MRQDFDGKLACLHRQICRSVEHKFIKLGLQIHNVHVELMKCQAVTMSQTGQDEKEPATSEANNEPSHVQKKRGALQRVRHEEQDSGIDEVDDAGFPRSDSLTTGDPDEPHRARSFESKGIAGSLTRHSSPFEGTQVSQILSHADAEGVTSLILDVEDEVKDHENRIDEFVALIENVNERLHTVEKGLEEAKMLVASDCLCLARGAIKDSAELRTIGWLGDDVGKSVVASTSEEVSTQLESPGGSSDDIDVHCYRLQETVWDAAILLGLSDIGCASNVLLLMGLVTNIVVQGTFCWMISTLSEEFNDYTDDGVDAFSAWRSQTPSGIVGTICSLNHTVPSYNYHTWATVHDASNYLRSNLGSKHGPVLCIVVVTVWTLIMFRAMKAAVDFIMAIHDSYDRRVTNVQLQTRLRPFSISKTPCRRVAWAWVLGLMQVALSCFLLVVGAQWLVTTTRSDDLVSNAVALTFILEVDELIFICVVPRQVHNIIMNLEPIPFSSKGCSRWLHIPCSSVVALSAMVVFVASAWLGALSNHAEQVTLVLDEICA